MCYLLTDSFHIYDINCYNFMRYCGILKYIFYINSHIDKLFRK
jgi:hypothetical protein